VGRWDIKLRYPGSPIPISAHRILAPLPDLPDAPTPMRPIPRYAILHPLFALIACGACGESSSRDARIPEWTLGASPSVRIGVADGGPAYTLDRVVGALRLPDGRIVVADAGSRELRVFSAEGQHLISLGGRGKGPGEFDALTWAGHMRGDTVATWDHGLLRWSLFTPAGFVGSVAPDPQPDGMFPRAIGVLSDGSFVLASGWNVGVLAGGVAGVRRDTTTITRYGRDGRSLGVVVRVPGREEYLKSGGAGFSTNPVPFARETYLAVAGQGIWLGDSERFRVERRSPEGRVVGVVADESQGAPIGVADVERYKRDRLARITVDSYRKQQEEVLAEVPFPSTAPAFGGLIADGGGVWISDFSPRDAGRTWRIFDANGREVAILRTPKGLELMQVTDDYVVGWALGENDVERVLVYELTRYANDNSVERDRSSQSRSSSVYECLTQLDTAGRTDSLASGALSAECVR
jgi:hypothetical protein